MNTHFMNVLNYLDMITEGKADYLDEYKKYVLAHKERVKKFSLWLQRNLPEIFNDVDINVFNELIDEHDDSKFSEEEFEPYANFWYNDSEHYDYDPVYEAAWEHHWLNNEHHPEYWNGQDIPYIYILEMLCDWGSFGIASGNITELIDYYYEEARDDDEKSLSANTKKIIEEILEQIKTVSSKGGN